MEFTPQKINVKYEYPEGHVVTNEDYNNALNLLGAQGNNNTEGLVEAQTDIHALQDIFVEDPEDPGKFTVTVADGAVTPAKLADNAVEARHISDDSFRRIPSLEQLVNAQSNLARMSYEAAPSGTEVTKFANVYVKKSTTSEGELSIAGAGRIPSMYTPSGTTLYVNIKGANPLTFSTYETSTNSPWRFRITQQFSLRFVPPSPAQQQSSFLSVTLTRGDTKNIAVVADGMPQGDKTKAWAGTLKIHYTNGTSYTWESALTLARNTTVERSISNPYPQQMIDYIEYKVNEELIFDVFRNSFSEVSFELYSYCKYEWDGTAVTSWSPSLVFTSTPYVEVAINSTHVPQTVTLYHDGAAVTGIRKRSQDNWHFYALAPAAAVTAFTVGVVYSSDPSAVGYGYYVVG